MKYKHLFIFLLFSCMAWNVNSQQITGPLTIGDTVPDISLGRVINGHYDSARISDFRGKLLILDFWFTGCSVCIQQFPKMAALQEKFKEQLVILPVGFDAYTPGSIEAFVNKRKGTSKAVPLPTAIQKTTDTLLMRLFPFVGMPHEVWIDANGVVQGITGHLEVKEENISRLLAGKQVAMRIRKTQKGFDASQPFLLKGNGGPDMAFTRRSVLSGYIDSIGGSPYRATDSLYTRLFYPNQTLMTLYQQAFYHSNPQTNNWLYGDYLFKRMIYHPKDSLKKKQWIDADDMSEEQYRAFLNHYLFCYELMVPSSYTIAEASSQMIADLNNTFKIEPAVKKKRIDCLVLTVKPKRQREKSQVRSPLNSEAIKDIYHLNEKISPDQLSHYFNGFFINLPVTLNGIKSNQPMELNIQFEKTDDMSAVNKKLQPFGLHLKRKKMKLPMLLLRGSQ